MNRRELSCYGRRGWNLTPLHMKPSHWQLAISISKPGTSWLHPRGNAARVGMRVGVLRQLLVGSAFAKLDALRLLAANGQFASLTSACGGESICLETDFSSRLLRCSMSRTDGYGIRRRNLFSFVRRRAASQSARRVCWRPRFV